MEEYYNNCHFYKSIIELCPNIVNKVYFFTILGINMTLSKRILLKLNCLLNSANNLIYIDFT